MTEPIQTVVPDLYVLPLPTPFPIGRINAYLTTSSPVTLIDTGVNSDRSYDALVAGLAALDLTTADLERIIITHHHADHIGQVDRLAAESGAEVWCHELCVPYVETPRAAREHLDKWSMIAWQEADVPQEILGLTEQLLVWFASLSNGPTAVNCVLSDGDSIALAGHEWQVLHTPGHAGDLICLFQPDTKVLLSSDHLLRDVSSNALAEPPQNGHKRPRRLLEYMAQMERVAALDPSIAYGGHGKPATDIPALVAERLSFHRERADRILALMGDESHTLYAITEQMFAHVADAEKFLALSEVLGHLDLLEREHRIVRTAETPVVRWQVVRT
jgi:glyoxylase-like metal-dependent hydrolase (beta-lactamase superfamily II)